jgi:2-dehydropantoate 2-reductase
MRLLVFGAGAFGTLFGARLCATGQDVSILARGERLEAIRRDGIRIRERVSGEALTAHPTLVTQVAHARPWDLVIVLVRRAQVDDVLRLIAADHSGDVLVMVNEARGYDPWSAILGPRLMVGFGGAMAAFDDTGLLLYKIAPRALQPTVIGQPDGEVPERVTRAAAALRQAGFPVQIRRDMEAWQRTHAAWIVPFMLVSAAAARTGERIDSERVRTWVRATQEGLLAVKASGTPLVPLPFRALTAVPNAITVGALRVALQSEAFRAQIAASGALATAEGVALAADLEALAGRPLPNLAALVAAVAP